MPRVLLVLAVLALVFYVVSIVDCAVQSPHRHRGVSRGVWILIIVVLPVLGGILWFTIGRARKQTAAARRAPDDDPDFLGTVGTISPISDQDERIRRLEEELAQLDSEADDPMPPYPSLAGSDLPGTTDKPGKTEKPGKNGKTDKPGKPGKNGPPADAADPARSSDADGDDPRHGAG